MFKIFLNDQECKNNIEKDVKCGANNIYSECCDNDHFSA